ncbi:hypothetical protein [Legionella sp. km535]|uniref:hypothetical protein n=1 Tax=Legionella sp. km535 TaxID=2498107 RepID=UPI0013152FC8|nr:hypothetical protein [Legionella sp. km535]
MWVLIGAAKHVAEYGVLYDRHFKMVLHLRALISSKGRWEQFWVRINQAGLIGLAEIC